SYSSTLLRRPHSFPTRRSSDLTGTYSTPSHPAELRRAGLVRPGAAVGSCGRPRCGRVDQWTVSTTDPCRRTLPWTSSSSTRSPRSEEHTSELQSRENLVCRLLL